MSYHTPKRYRWEHKGVSFDFYRLCEILGLKSQPQIHAIKKLIRAGQSVKPIVQDIDEAIDALNRWKEMIKEDSDEQKAEKVSGLQKHHEKRFVR